MIKVGFSRNSPMSVVFNTAGLKTQLLFSNWIVSPGYFSSSSTAESKGKLLLHRAQILDEHFETEGQAFSEVSKATLIYTH